MPETHVTPIGASTNRQTRVLDGVGGPRIALGQLEDAYRRALSDARASRWNYRDVDGYRLYWCRPGSPLESRDLPELPAAYTVVGRHAECRAHLDTDREVALRHLLVRPARLDDGTLALRFIDLRAEMPFFLLDESPRRSIAAAGPVAIRLGRYALVALPFRHGEVVASDTLEPPIVHEAIRPPERIEDSAPSSSNITILPSVTGVMDIARRHAPGDATFTVMRDDASASVGVSRADLDRGVLIGRLPRCLDGGIRGILSAQISRAHLLVLAEGSRVIAFDLASTNGTFKRGRPVSCARLRDGGTTLSLSRTQGVTFRFTREPLTS